MHRVSNFFSLVFWILVAGLTGCQQLNVPVDSKTDPSNVSWKELSIQRENIPTSTNSNDNIEADAVESSAPTSIMTPESNVQVMTVAPQDLDPQIFLGQSPDELKNRLGAPSIIRKEGNVEIWQYQLSDCVIDFFFYYKAGTQVATHTDMRSPFLGGKLNRATCRATLYTISQ